MNKRVLIPIISALLILPACQSRRNNEVVKMTFIHKYGVPVNEADWNKQGKNGQIVALTNEGVTVTKSYDKGVLEGVTSYTYPNSSTVKVKEHYEKGNMLSRVEHYPSGVPYCEESFKGSELIARTSWYEQGTPCAIERYNNGYLIKGEYRNLSNEIESRVVEGHGTRLQRTYNGELSAQETIQNGVMIECITFYANGEPKSVTPYENGLIHGTCLTFFPGAVPHTVEQWVHGSQNGITILYQNGEKIASIPYVQGKREGVALSYRDGTTIAEEVTWKRDHMHGKRTLYIEEGETKVEWYIEGRLVNKPTFDRLDPIR